MPAACTSPTRGRLIFPSVRICWTLFKLGDPGKLIFRMSPSRKVNEAGLFVVVEELAITASGMTGRMELVTAGVAGCELGGLGLATGDGGQGCQRQRQLRQPGKEAAS